ncbi:MAG TPA: hypothetical protein DE045_06900 [Oceanospirillaceae bacterium]|nr:hypothetical protein [Oceanospirillaceae bacterium]
MLMKTELSTFDQYNLMTKAALMRLARGYNVKGSLFADPLSNPKVAKNAKENGVLTYPLHLAPATVSGYNTCAMASAGCKEACLNTAGNPMYKAGKEAARTAKTRLYFENRALFVALLVKEVVAARNKAKKLNMALAFRPNATSDIKWEVSKVKHAGVFMTVAELIHSAAPDAKIYDYTKIPNRTTPAYYSLTFSLSEDNDKLAASELARGHNVAAVFDTKRGQGLPMQYTIHGVTAPVIDGDLTDYRPDDAPGAIVGLRAKGDAIGDQSGFVRPALQSVFLAA